VRWVNYCFWADFDGLSLSGGLDQSQFQFQTAFPQQAFSPPPQQQQQQDAFPTFAPSQPIQTYQPLQPMQPLQPTQPIQPTPLAQPFSSVPSISPAQPAPQTQPPVAHAQTSMSSVYLSRADAALPSACVLSKNGLDINAQFEKVPTSNENLLLHCKIVNNLPTPLTDFTIQLAVPKVNHCKQDTTRLSPFNLFFFSP